MTSITSGLDMRTHTSTTRRPHERLDTRVGRTKDTMSRKAIYILVSLCCLALFVGARYISGTMHAQFMGESLALVIVLLSCQVCFHLHSVDEVLVDPKPHLFAHKVLKSAGIGLLLAALALYLVPKLSPGYAAVAASACFLIFGLVVIRPIVRSLVRDEESSETVIVGSEGSARKLYRE